MWDKHSEWGGSHSAPGNARFQGAQESSYKPKVSQSEIDLKRFSISPPLCTNTEMEELSADLPLVSRDSDDYGSADNSAEQPGIRVPQSETAAILPPKMLLGGQYDLEAGKVSCNCLRRKWGFCEEMKILAGGKITPALVFTKDLRNEKGAKGSLELQERLRRIVKGERGSGLGELKVEGVEIVEGVEQNGSEAVGKNRGEKEKGGGGENGGRGKEGPVVFQSDFSETLKAFLDSPDPDIAYTDTLISEAM